MERRRSSGVMKEAKAEIKKIESHRPSTPFNRSLKNKSQRTALQVSRPSSCASIKSLKYESENNCIALSSRKSLTEKFEKDIVDNSEIKLEPIVTKPVICHRRSSCSSIKQKSDSEFLGFPPLSNQKNDNKISKHCLIEERLHLLELSEENVTSIKDNFDSVKHYFDNHPINKSFSSESLNVSLPGNEIVDEEVEKLSEELCIFLPLLEKNIKQGSKRQTEEIILIIQDINELLKKRNAFLTMFNHRSQLLKLLFKLLDSNAPKLSFNIIKILLQMKVKENNLTNIFRLILKMLKEKSMEKDDNEFIYTLLENMLEVTVSTNEGATMYSLRILRQLFCDSFDFDLMEKSIAVLNHHLKEFNKVMSAGQEFFIENEQVQNHTQMIIQILSIFHDLFDDKKTRKLLMDSNLSFHVLNTLNNFYQQGNIVHIAVRLISKIIEKEDCESIAKCSDDLILNLLRMLEFYKFFIDITLQITFIIGHFVSFGKTQAFLFLLHPDFMKTVLNVFDTYIHEHIQFKENVSECFRNMNSSGNNDFHDGICDVIIKVLSIFASMCLTQETGSYLVTQNSLTTHLLSVIDSYRRLEDKFYADTYIYPFLIVLGNISYFLPSNSNMCIATVTGVMLYLDETFSYEIRLESANIIRNLTRHQVVREHIQENSFFAYLIKLLTASDKELSTAAYGIVMNMLIDQNTHETFYIEQGIIRVLHKLHLCAERDWKTSAMMCQILWNFCKGKNSDNYPFSRVEVQHLIKFLAYYTYEKKRVVEKDQKSYDEWKNEFCPVADKLLENLEKINSNST